ncbi:Pre-mRNA-splicing factor slt11 [Glutinoglossum americanum]|uniref:Pre-mRNA-splicing factor slt11 n=1 Tax=Glutinoglossum americanum TaxID=1670608 RepID=A0A9P8IA67_9PEZI|nr:Pre-mRNA-splicing factor slt11 [Glutinoglossum americanum]
MPPQIKQDLNRSGWESTDFPSVCENCLPDNPYVQMLKTDSGAECKICTRPFTVFQWKADRTARSKRTNICLTCARLKNCCQCCMLDLSFGLPIVVRDAALKLVAPGPGSSINREYYAQEHEKEIEEGRGDVEEYEKTDEKARELLRRLANSEPYYKRQRRTGPSDGGGRQGDSVDGGGDGQKRLGPGPIRTRESRGRGGGPGARGGMRGGRGGARGGRGVFPGQAQLPPGPQDILPPDDQSITSLFLTGVEDDLPEHALKTFFSPFGTLRSVVCSHRSHCAFINFATRAGAEAAAESCQGKAVIAGCPLRIQWGRPRPIGNMERNERIETGKEGRAAVAAAQYSSVAGAGALEASAEEEASDLTAIAPPPGASEVKYASQSGN